MKNRAASGIEIIVVVAIIGLLAAMVFPRFVEESEKKLKETRVERTRTGELTASEWREEMIRRGLAEYNPTNGVWQWKRGAQ